MPDTDHRTRCVACREPIQLDARVCPHCHTAQAPERWKALASILKWIGGVTAVISLVIGMLQLNSLFRNWQDRQETVHELVQAADMQSQAGDYGGAWKLLNQALELDAGSRLARRRQVQVAMQWLRNMRIAGEQRFTDVVEILLPILYRGAASASGHTVADIVAHLGWADYLRYREGKQWLDVEQHFQRALSIDPDNVYAHAMQGFWMLWPRNRAGQPDALQRATFHFAAALQSGKERAYVRDLQMRALLNVDHDLEVRLETIRVANQMRLQHESLDAELRRRVLRAYNDALRTEELMQQLVSVLPPADHLHTFLWLNDGTRPLLEEHIQAFFVARLTEESGDVQQALTRYTTLREQVSSNSWLVRYNHLEQALQRLHQKQTGDALQTVVMIRAIPEDSAWHRLGLRTGDLIVAYDGSSIHSRAQLMAAMHNAAQKDTAALVVIRDQEPKHFTLAGGRLDVPLEDTEVPKWRLGSYALQ